MLRAPLRSGERHNVVYDLARSEGIDGLVLLAGTLANHLGLDDLARYCERYRPRPMSSVAVELDGMTGILVDGEQACERGSGTWWRTTSSGESRSLAGRRGTSRRRIACARTARF
jgi:hypothetical protein